MNQKFYPSPDTRIIQLEAEQEFNDIFNTLPERSRLILISRFCKNKTLKMIGKEWNLSGERIRWIVHISLVKLRHPKYKQRLKDIYNDRYRESY